MSGINGAEQDAGGLPFSDAARRLLADALQEAIGLGHVYIGTEHLLLALARRSNEVAGLTDLGIDWGRVRTRVAEVVNPGTPAATPERSLPYTTRTQRVFTLAGESARDLGHPRVEAEHLLLGLVREGTGIAAFVLGEQGVTE